MNLVQVVTVLKKSKYLTVAIVVAFLVFTFAVWLPNLKLIGLILISSTVSFAEKFSFLISLYASIGTNFTAISASYTIVIAILFGVNIALLTYYIARARDGVRGVGSTGITGIGGLVSGIFGIGCAACGTFILTSVLALFGATGFLAFLPFGGEEFGVLGVLLLSYSIYMITKKISDPLVCEIR